MERGDRYLPVDCLFERITGVIDPVKREVSARKTWLMWIKRLRQTAERAESESWGKSDFKADQSTINFRRVLRRFCKGTVPLPESQTERGRFDSLFEIITPPSPPAAYPTSLAYTGVPVGSARGVGVSPSASQFVPPSDPARHENYVDGPTIKSRKRGSSPGRIGGGKVVQRKARS
jgi:hypothetical protein